MLVDLNSWSDLLTPDQEKKSQKREGKRNLVRIFRTLDTLTGRNDPAPMWRQGSCQISVFENKFGESLFL